MSIRKAAIIISLLLGIIFVLIYYFIKNPYVGLVGYALQLLGSLLFLEVVLTKLSKTKKEHKTD